MNLQLQIVEELKLQLLENINANITLHSVFANYRSGRGLRLTKGGCILMQKVYDSYEIKIKSNKPIKTKDVILLEKNLEYPYFITDKKLVLFNEKDTVDFKLYNGDFIAWCKTKRYYE
jgi:hypothetical protein|tara:strand:- start:31 stop:384 length:354 start_codon:yes stop_codon:yes gene_type:complete